MVALDRDRGVGDEVGKDALHSGEVDGLEGAVSVEEELVGVRGGRDFGLYEVVVVVEDEVSG